jgi:hypothetical protein
MGRLGVWSRRALPRTRETIILERPLSWPASDTHNACPSERASAAVTGGRRRVLLFNGAPPGAGCTPQKNYQRFDVQREVLADCVGLLRGHGVWERGDVNVSRGCDYSTAAPPHNSGGTLCGCQNRTSQFADKRIFLRKVDRNLRGYLPRLSVLLSIEANRPRAWFPGP